MEEFTFSNIYSLLTMNDSINDEIKKVLISELPGVFFRRTLEGDQRFTKMSKNWTNLLEFDLEESENDITIRDFIHPDDIETLFETIEKKIRIGNHGLLIIV